VRVAVMGMFPSIHHDKELSMSDLRSVESTEVADWNRVGAIAGVVYAVMSIAGWLLWQFGGGELAVSLSAPTAEVARWYHQHQDVTRIALVPWSLALGPLLVFLVCFYRRLRTAEGGSGTASTVFLAGSIIGGSIYIGVSFLFLWAAAFRPGEVSPEITQFSRDLVMLTGPPLCGTFAVALFAAGVVIHRRGVFARWLGTAAIACGFCQLLYVFGGFTDSGALNPQNGILGALIPYGTHFVWIIAACVLMIKQSRPQAVVQASRNTRHLTQDWSEQ
jgi:hypothetical protein